MKKYGFFATLSALCFLITGGAVAFQIYSLLQAGIASPVIPLLGLQLLCLALIALHLLVRGPLNVYFAILPAVCLCAQLLRLSAFGRGLGNLTQGNLLSRLPWLTMALGCLLAAGSRGEVSPGKRIFFFVPAILNAAALVMNYGIDRLLLVLRIFDPERIQAWINIAPIALEAGFLLFALWAASGAAAAPVVETAAAVPQNLTGDEDRIVRQYRGFLEAGIITRAEFDAKMRSLRKK